MRMPEKKRRKWTNEQMIAAIKAVEKNGSGINQAAIAHNVPKTTLKDRLSGRVQHGSKPGPKLLVGLLSCKNLGLGDGADKSIIF